MIKKKHIVEVASVIVIAFLIGTIFNMNFVVSGGKGKGRDEDLWNAISELQSEVDSLNASLIELQARVETLESLSGFPTPDYDSGWTYLTSVKTTFTHNLGTTEALVYVIGKSDTWHGINQVAYGSRPYCGLYWHTFNETSIIMAREPGDIYWEQVRVMIWKISEPPT